MLRHCSKIFVSPSLSLTAWQQRVPGIVGRSSDGAPTWTETLVFQAQVRNLKDVRTSIVRPTTQ